MRAHLLSSLLPLALVAAIPAGCAGELSQGNGLVGSAASPLQTASTFRSQTREDATLTPQQQAQREAELMAKGAVARSAATNIPTKGQDDAAAAALKAKGASHAADAIAAIEKAHCVVDSSGRLPQNCPQ